MIGFLIGFISFLLAGAGLGGGVLLIPLLTSFLNMDAILARAVCLSAYVIASIFSLAVAAKTKMFSKKILAFIPLGVLGAVLGAFISIEEKVFSKIYGIFLIVFGLYIVYNTFFKRKNDKV